ncbi:predicted protein [Naegleria gruberi]|uniref:Predicted protein n=1 Tax=Naegleria gruberi TaxID=5762 RepID=D2V0M0_NAEGR|nr:uncharacterized protein NAEGRDRAFT_30081 [Naegleria gruberi]EFC49745.1 predicted protein [Naegleria gruberi]|eukprot:XP_002682489.1 predicted protein [Naegleria gruberi strain NEG-M]
MSLQNSTNNRNYQIECSLNNLLQSGVDISKKKHNGSVLHCQFSKGNGQYCMSAGADKNIKLLNPYKSFFVLKEYKSHGYEVFDIDISNDNNYFVSASADKNVFLWDVSTGEVKRRFKEHKGKVNCVKYNFNNEIIMSGSYDRTLKVWDVRSASYKSVQNLGDFQDSVSSITSSDSSIIAGCVDGTVHIYDIRMGKLKVDDLGGASVGHVSISKNYKTYCCSLLNSTILMIEIESGNILRTLTGHTNEKYQIKHTISNDDRYLLSGDENGNIFEWNLENEQSCKIPKIDSDSTPVVSIDYHPKGKY